MNGLFVDSNVILDIFLDDPNWADWSETTLNQYSIDEDLYINPIIYTNTFAKNTLGANCEILDDT